MKHIFAGIAAAAVLMASIAGSSLAETAVQNSSVQARQRIEQNRRGPRGMAGQQNQEGQQDQMTPPAMPEQGQEGNQNQMTPPAMPGQQNQEGQQDQMTPPAMPDQGQEGDQNQTTPPEMPEQGTQGDSNSTMTVNTGNKGKLNMRAKPGTDARVTGRYRNGTQVEILEVGDEWVKVSINGKTGYMMVQFLEGELPAAQTDEAAEPAAEESTEISEQTAD